MSFIRNTWYAAAWSKEVSGELKTRQIIDEHIVFYRDSENSVVALADMCPHRFAPLHLGNLIDDVLYCPYHGLGFNKSGQCVKNPHGDKIPTAAKVKTYPIIERHNLIWIWMGEEKDADASLIPDYSILEQSERFAYTDGVVMTMPVNYELILDNLVDLTHAAYLHPTNLGCEAVANGVVNVQNKGDTLSVLNEFPTGHPAPVFTALGVAEADSQVNYYVDVHWTPPAKMYFDAGIYSPGETRNDGVKLSSIQILTPASKNSTHYLWCQFRDFNIEDESLTNIIEAAVTQAFATEDEPMILAVQERMQGQDLFDLNPVLLNKDVAGVQVRRIIQRLLKDEQAQ